MYFDAGLVNMSMEFTPALIGYPRLNVEENEITYYTIAV